jgi:V8-like Glu-specific endopeptidase
MPNKRRKTTSTSRTRSAAQQDAAGPTRTAATVNRPGTEQSKTKRDTLQMGTTQTATESRSLDRARAERSADLSDAVLAGRGGLVHQSLLQPFQHFTPGKRGEPGHFSLTGDQFKDVVLVNQNLNKDPDCYYQTITFHDRYQQLRTEGVSEERALLLAQGYANKRENILRTQEAYARSPLTAESRLAIKQSLLTGTIGDYGGVNVTGKKAAVTEDPQQREQLSLYREAGVKRNQSALIAFTRDGAPSHGSGFLITPNIVVTCAHNLEGNEGRTAVVINNVSYDVADSVIHPKRTGEQAEAEQTDAQQTDAEREAKHEAKRLEDRRTHDLAVIKLTKDVPGAKSITFGALDVAGGGLQLLGYPSLSSSLANVAFNNDNDAEVEALGRNLEKLGYTRQGNARALWQKIMARAQNALAGLDQTFASTLASQQWSDNTFSDADTTLKDLLSHALDADGNLYRLMQRSNVGQTRYPDVEQALIAAAYLVAADDLRASGKNTQMQFQSRQNGKPEVFKESLSFVHGMDAVDGNSGSPIFQGDKLVGVHVRGEGSTNTAMYLGGKHGSWIFEQVKRFR